MCYLQLRPVAERLYLPYQLSSKFILGTINPRSCLLGELVKTARGGSLQDQALVKGGGDYEEQEGEQHRKTIMAIWKGLRPLPLIALDMSALPPDNHRGPGRNPSI
ncbi:Uncharacterized protein HZ326_21027 [Fusarium oxysporum f. sp. albedinis]|nr:Uncharacterized protein HZ326_21027 [Fusarium oxysporum f. sp. albedinis]